VLTRSPELKRFCAEYNVCGAFAKPTRQWEKKHHSNVPSIPEVPLLTPALFDRWIHAERSTINPLTGKVFRSTLTFNVDIIRGTGG
jgi:hypothetical protein